MKVTAETLTIGIVQSKLARLRGNREIEYLCRAYLQFGLEAMTPDDLRKLCDAVNGARP